jgi:hypothetical protein
MALIDEASVIERIPRHLRLPTEAPAPRPGRAAERRFRTAPAMSDSGRSVDRRSQDPVSACYRCAWRGGGAASPNGARDV